MRTKPTISETKLTAICNGLESGNGLDVAARCAGVGPRTVRDWLAEGRRIRRANEGAEEAPLSERDALYVSAYDRVEEARARAEARNVRIIAKAAQRTWQAAAWWLERRYPQRWGRRERLDHKVAGAPVVIRVTPETARAFAPPDDEPPSNASRVAADDFGGSRGP